MRASSLMLPKIQNPKSQNRFLPPPLQTLTPLAKNLLRIALQFNLLSLHCFGVGLGCKDFGVDSFRQSELQSITLDWMT